MNEYWRGIVEKTFQMALEDLGVKENYRLEMAQGIPFSGDATARLKRVRIREDLPGIELVRTALHEAYHVLQYQEWDRWRNDRKQMEKAAEDFCQKKCWHYYRRVKGIEEEDLYSLLEKCFG